MTKDNFVLYLKDLGIEVSSNQLEQFDKYYKLLVEWNEKINLTSITEENEVYLKHFYDSATIVKAINLNECENLCDVGTGAGFPGIVLKILFPKLHITLVDALEKRINFLKIVIDELNLNDIEVFHERSEEFAKDHREEFDVVTARAVAQLPILIEYCVPMVKTNKYFVPMKANISQEIIDSKNAMNTLSIKIEEKVEFLLPFENSNRTIIKFKKLKSTSNKYPRKFSEIKKKPL